MHSQPALTNVMFSTGVAGCWAPHVIHDVVHNRTVNIRGGLGHNIEMDRYCEQLNCSFKGADTILCCDLGYPDVHSIA